MKQNPIPRMKVQPFSQNYVTRRNPWVPVWWSVALPGFGHLYMGQHLKGLILMSWEILVNAKANLNLAIYHSLMGQPEVAQSVLHYEWLIIYPLFYVFAMFDSYRACLELNQLADLERFQKDRYFDNLSETMLGIVTLSRRNPTMSALWSACVPGFGQFYNDRGLRSLTLMVWYIAIIFKSGLAPATFHTLRGELHLVNGILDYQWLLFWPSIYIFGIADAYQDTVEQNQIVDDAFRWRMRKYLRNGRK